MASGHYCANQEYNLPNVNPDKVNSTYFILFQLCNILEKKTQEIEGKIVFTDQIWSTQC